MTAGESLGRAATSRKNSRNTEEVPAARIATGTSPEFSDQAGLPAWPPSGPARHPCAVWIMSNMGMYMATTMPPMTTPMKTIMMGSRMDVSALTAASTSSS